MPDYRLCDHLCHIDRGIHNRGHDPGWNGGQPAGSGDRPTRYGCSHSTNYIECSQRIVIPRRALRRVLDLIDQGTGGRETMVSNPGGLIFHWDDRQGHFRGRDGEILDCLHATQWGVTTQREVHQRRLLPRRRRRGRGVRIGNGLRGRDLDCGVRGRCWRRVE